MFNFQRLSRDEYAFMGRSQVWTLWDACVLLTAFELEVAGEFGETQELPVLNRLFSENELDKSFQGKWDKWRDLLNQALFSKELAYVNMPSDSEYKQKNGNYIEAESSFRRDSLYQVLKTCEEDGRVNIDLQLLNDYLKGKGSAPVQNVQVVQMSKSDMASSLSSNRNPVPKEKVRSHVLELWAQGCTCWHNFMRDHVIEHFNAVEKDDNETLDNEKVTVKLSKNVIMRELKSLYSEHDKKDQIFDKKNHGGKRNACQLHPAAK